MRARKARFSINPFSRAQSEFQLDRKLHERYIQSDCRKRTEGNCVRDGGHLSGTCIWFYLFKFLVGIVCLLHISFNQRHFCDSVHCLLTIISRHMLSENIIMVPADDLHGRLRDVVCTQSFGISHLALSANSQYAWWKYCVRFVGVCRISTHNTQMWIHFTWWFCEMLKTPVFKLNVYAKRRQKKNWNPYIFFLEVQNIFLSVISPHATCLPTN